MHRIQVTSKQGREGCGSGEGACLVLCRRGEATLYLGSGHMSQSWGAFGHEGNHLRGLWGLTDKDLKGPAGGTLPSGVVWGPQAGIHHQASLGVSAVREVIVWALREQGPDLWVTLELPGDTEEISGQRHPCYNPARIVPCFHACKGPASSYASS